jgi:hydantoinase/carbamoylase family amidase
MAADAQRMIAELRELAELTGTDRGAQRVAWTEIWARARDWERRLLAELPVQVEIDEAGNQWATLRGASPQAVIIGSHIDSVPDGGWLDGCLGVLAGLEVMRVIAAEGTPPLTVRLVDWADEEGARFGLSLLGSMAAAGELDPEFVGNLRDAEGMTARQALAAHGVDVATMGRAGGQLRQAVAYVELHIEQGPVLEERRLPLAVVTGTYGAERWSVRFDGQTGHAGSTPMDQRRDALLAAARLALEVRELARTRGGVGTVGRIDAEPGIPTAVAGSATALIDQRHVDAGVLRDLHERAEAASRAIAAEERVDVSWSPLARISPIAFDPELIDAAAAIVADLQRVDAQLPSGPLHDAARVAEAGVPTVMLFVRSKRGLSHTREEDTDETDLALALTALERLVRHTLNGAVASVGPRTSGP